MYIEEIIYRSHKNVLTYLYDLYLYSKDIQQHLLIIGMIDQ